MKPVLTTIAVIGSIIVFSASSEAAVGQQYVFTRGGLNGNICRAQGKACHLPQTMNPAPTMPQTMPSSPVPTSAIPVNPPSGIISNIISGFTSLF